MTSKTPGKLQLVLAESEGSRRISVDMEAFFEFSFWLAEQLQDLETDWSHFARPRRRATRDRRPKP